jgi:putative DNA primase/helicase
MIAVEHLPVELRASTRAVVWRFEERDGRRTKVPYQARYPWRRASVTAPATWGSFAEALAVVRAGRADGLGHVLGDGLAGVDLDHCLLASALTDEALAIVRALDSYTEVSPSGHGVKVFVRGTLPSGRRRTGTIEMYAEKRFFTVTGRHVAGTPRTLEERTAALAAVHRAVFGAPDSSRPAASSGPREVAADDDKLLAQARRGAKFDRLWHGDTAGYDSASQADLALCNLLAYWTGGDTGRVDRLFRASGLFRTKWDAKRGDRTYGARTIACALAGRR